jgi:hypothetical protein
VTVQSVNGQSGTVNLSVSGMPAGVSAQLYATQLPLGAGGQAGTTLEFTGSANMPGGTYPLVLTGTLGSLPVRTAAFSLGTQVTTFQVSSVTGSAIAYNSGQEVQVTQSVPANNAPAYTTCDSADPNVTCRVISASASAVTVGITAGTSAVHGTRVLRFNDAAATANLTIADDPVVGALSVSTSQSAIPAGLETDVVVNATDGTGYTCVYDNYCDAAVEVVDQSGQPVSWPVYFFQDPADNGISVTLSPGLGDAGADTLAMGWCFPYNYAVVEVETACEIGSATLPVNAAATPVCATPTNFTEAFQGAGADGTLYFNYTWSSSTGSNADLSSCKIGETVFYPGTNNPYQWPAPMVTSTANPTLISGSATNALILDRNMPPTSYSSPYIAASFDATQRFWWDCPCYKTGNLQYPLETTITRKVFQDSTDGKWKYQITKSSQAATAILP